MRFGAGRSKVTGRAEFILRDSPRSRCENFHLKLPWRAALEYAETVTITGASVSDALMAQLSKHFDEEGIVELTALVAFQNLSSKFNSALDVPAQGFCELPDRE